MSLPATMENTVLSFENGFNEVNAYKLNFKKEANFALQLLKGSEFLFKVAQQDPESLKNAITNIAAIGISLNPATKEAYLVPRKGKICLDISAIGLIKLATDSGSILWGQAKLVHEKDKYESRGMGKLPLHEYSPFSDRGQVIGTYAVVKTSDLDYLVEEMSVNDCFDIRDRSEAWKSFKDGKAKSCPWETDPGEMCKKTVIKRGQKYWPKSERLDTAVKVLNEHEGIEFSREKIAHVDASAFLNPPPENDAFQLIREKLAANNKTESGLLAYLIAQFKGAKLEKLEDMNGAQIEYANRILGGGK